MTEEEIRNELVKILGPEQDHGCGEIDVLSALGLAALVRWNERLEKQIDDLKSQMPNPIEQAMRRTGHDPSDPQN